MDEQLQKLMQELGNAINDALSESDGIAEAIGGIKKAGYDVFLVLEATIGFNRREPEAGEEEETPQEPATEWNGRPKFTSQDMRFAKALKISLDDPNSPPDPFPHVKK